MVCLEPYISNKMESYTPPEDNGPHLCVFFCVESDQGYPGFCKILKVAGIISNLLLEDLIDDLLLTIGF